jgi:CheY-like chemotaxis protein
MRSGTPVILVVEDEAIVRMMAVSVAENAGFEALGAATADEAIKILESRLDIRLVFTDVNMPGSMDGLRLAHAVRNRWPPVELIVTSGRSHIRRMSCLNEAGSLPSHTTSTPYRRLSRRWQAAPR